MRVYQRCQIANPRTCYSMWREYITLTHKRSIDTEVAFMC